ncbi:Hypothetical predicted protein [Paramuricea clavata]|uniref:Uncharacterized protein n=1 Tax=Paramuricea clavata TaxID=317549 RepID=A0A6S7H476_PARCT|nr:Hypothetical predicted protein [Paramuricea clavata]
MSLVGVKTRSNNTQADIQEVVQSEISKYLMSSDFKQLLRDSFKEALSGMIAQVVKPFEEKTIKLQEKVLQLEEKCNDNEQYSHSHTELCVQTQNNDKQTEIKGEEALRERRFNLDESAAAETSP